MHVTIFGTVSSHFCSKYFNICECNFWLACLRSFQNCKQSKSASSILTEISHCIPYSSPCTMSNGSSLITPYKVNSLPSNDFPGPINYRETESDPIIEQRDSVP